jgi:hypothetical protein
MSGSNLPILLALVAVVSFCGGCGSESPTSPTTVTPPSVVNPPVDSTTMYTLSGEVFEITEAGRVPVENVELYCDSCGSEFGHTFAYTDANGFYSFAWSRNGWHPLLVRKAGYYPREADHESSGGRGSVVAKVDGDTRFDVELIRRP